MSIRSFLLFYHLRSSSNAMFFNTHWCFHFLSIFRSHYRLGVISLLIGLLLGEYRVTFHFILFVLDPHLTCIWSSHTREPHMSRWLIGYMKHLLSTKHVHLINLIRESPLHEVVIPSFSHFWLTLIEISHVIFFIWLFVINVNSCTFIFDGVA